MNILAIDTATTILSAALSSKDGIRHFEADAGLKHSEILMEAVDGLLKMAGLQKQDLEGIACMQGPGSFTGLRIGFAAAKGLALALNIPLIAVPTLDCMAAPVSVWPGIVLPVIDAKKGCFFTALFREGQGISDYMDAPPELILSSIRAALEGTAERNAPVLLTGPDAAMLEPALSAALTPPMLRLDPERRRGCGKILLKIAEKQLVTGTVSNAPEGPLYLRKSDAELAAR